MSDFKLPDYSRYSYGGLIDVKQHLEKNDTTGAYGPVIHEIKRRFPTMNSEQENSIKTYRHDRSNMTISMNRLYKFNSLEVLQNTGWMYLSVIIPFLFFRYYRDPFSFSLIFIVILLSSIIPLYWSLKYIFKNISYDRGLKRFYSKESGSITEFGFDDVEYCEAEVLKGFSRFENRKIFRKDWTIAFEITLVDKTIISIPYTIYAKDRVFEYLLNVCGLDKKKI